jgi:hypothetical protein
VGLGRGKVTLAVKHRSPSRDFRVETAEASVRVVGTRFGVERADHDAWGATSVGVDEGIVEVTSKVTKETRRLAASERWTITTEPPPAPAPPPAPVENDAPAATPLESPAAVEAPRVAAIRSRLRSGRISEAKALYAQANHQANQDPITRAELATVGAEIAFAERRYALALRSYLAVVKRFPSSRQAEAALFAAAQLALDHPDLGFDGRELLRRYLSQYPHGRFAQNVDSLLRALEQP